MSNFFFRTLSTYFLIFFFAPLNIGIINVFTYLSWQLVAPTLPGHQLLCGGRDFFWWGSSPGLWVDISRILSPEDSPERGGGDPFLLPLLFLLSYPPHFFLLSHPFPFILSSSTILLTLSTILRVGNLLISYSSDLLDFCDPKSDLLVKKSKSLPSLFCHERIRAIGANHSWLLFCSEGPERFAHGCSLKKRN